MIGHTFTTRAAICLCLLVAVAGCATTIDKRTEVAVPVSAVLDPTSRLFHMDQIVVMGYLRCFDDLSRLYATYDEAQRSALLNSITIVRESVTDDDTDSCPAEGEIELALCSYRGSLLLRDQYTAPWLIVDELLQCNEF